MIRRIIREEFPDNYQLACKRCNMAKQAMNDKEFREWINLVHKKINASPSNEDGEASQETTHNPKLRL